MSQRLTDVIREREEVQDEYREALATLSEADEILRDHLQPMDGHGNIRHMSELLFRALLRMKKVDVDAAREHLVRLQVEAQKLRLNLL